MWRAAILLLCATTVSAIIKGYETQEGDVPWAANVMFSNSKETHHCGAIVLSERWLLSAASCVRHGEYVGTALLGASNITNIRQPIPVNEVIIHEKFGSFSWKNDIALVRLSRPAVLDAYVQPIRLPSYTQAKKTTFKGWAATAAGWGKDGTTDVTPVARLRAVDIEVISNFACWFSYPIYLDDTNVCTDGKGLPCGGDEGGPLWVVEDDQIPTVIGIVSYEFSLGCTTLYPAVYARLTEFLKWIVEKTDGAIPIRD